MYLFKINVYCTRGDAIESLGIQSKYDRNKIN